jgi:hypothetical protein
LGEGAWGDVRDRAGTRTKQCASTERDEGE